jgi:hypothetical protein
MKRIYISSTVEDLKDYRLAVADALRKCGYDVDAMEKYPARDDRPKAASESDASNCDIYVGIFAWRYGYVPSEDNPEKKSVTELEYAAAGLAQKPRLIFLLADDAAWPGNLRDAEHEEDEGKRIRDLRKRLKTERWAAFFYSPENLAKHVLTSVFQYESIKRVGDLKTITEEMSKAVQMGPSYLTNIQQQIYQLGSVEFVALSLGPTPWWDTRLHLTAALASDFTEIREFVLLDEQGQFLTMAPPGEIRRALAKAVPKLEMAYLESREQAHTKVVGAEVDRIVGCYRDAVTKVYPDAAGFANPNESTESIVKQVVTRGWLRGLGVKPEGEVIEQVSAEHQPIGYSDLLRRRTRYLVVMRDGNLEGVIDRAELASRVASIL